MAIVVRKLVILMKPPKISLVYMSSCLIHIEDTFMKYSTESSTEFCLMFFIIVVWSRLNVSTPECANGSAFTHLVRQLGESVWAKQSKTLGTVMSRAARVQKLSNSQLIH